MQNFSIIIPTLNEADNVAPLLQRITTIARDTNLSPEVIFVDDGSSDGTCEQISAYQGDLHVRLHQRKGMRGLAGAVITGARLAEYEDLLIMDGDLSHPPERIPDLIKPLLSDKKEMVIGSRYIIGGSTPDWPLMRKISSRLATLPAHFLTGIEDPLAGFFSVKRKFLAELDPSAAGFKIGFELLCRYDNEIRTAEIPVLFTDRSYGKSKMSFSILIHYFFQLLTGYGVQYQALQRPLILLLGCIAALFDAFFFSVMHSEEVNITTCHITSFLIAMHVCFLLGLKCMVSIKNKKSQRSLIKCYRHFLFIILPVLFLRGGLLAALQDQSASQTTTLVILGIISFITLLLFAATQQSDLNGSKTGLFSRSIIVAIIFYSITLRLIYLGTTELLQEEAYYWNYAQHIAPGYLDHPPLVAALIGIGTNIFGNTEVGIRLGSYCCWFLTAYFSYALTRRMFNAKSAINAVLLVATLPIFFGSALVMTPDAPLITCWAATLYFLYSALCNDENNSWIWAGIFFGFGLLSKYTIIFLAPAALLFMLYDTAARRWLRSPMPYLATTIALILFSPVIWWNWENSWASFLFQSQTRIMDTVKFSTHELLASMLLLVTPVGLIAVMHSLYPFSNQTDNKDNSEADRLRRNRFCLIMTLTPLLVFIFFSITKEVKLNWTGPVWLATIPLMAHSILIHAIEKKEHINRLFMVGWPTTFFSLIIIYGAALHYLSIGIPGIPYPKNNILLGWDDLISQVEKTADRIEHMTGRRPVVVGMDKYRIASGISFYKNRETSISTQEVKTKLPQVTGRHLFDAESLMFRYWHPSLLFSGMDILALSTSRIGLHASIFERKTSQVGDIKELSIQKRGKTVGKYYYRLLTDYTPAVQKVVATYQNSISQIPR